MAGTGWAGFRQAGAVTGGTWSPRDPAGADQTRRPHGRTKPEPHSGTGPAVWGLHTGRRKPEASVGWPGARPAAAGPELPLLRQPGSRGAHSSRSRSLAMHFTETVGGISRSRSPPTSPLVLAVGSFTPHVGAKDIARHQTQEPGATGTILGRPLSKEAPRSPASAVPPSRWVSLSLRTAVSFKVTSQPPQSCLPCPLSDRDSHSPVASSSAAPQAGDPRNIFNSLSQMLSACSGRTRPQTLKCHLPARGQPHPILSFIWKYFVS